MFTGMGKDRTKAKKGHKTILKKTQRRRRVLSDAMKKVEIRRKQIAQRYSKKRKARGAIIWVQE